ncbi:MAG: DUF3488 domain-containing protein [Bacteriovoracaceae bacterium]|nr:DUF3488 domain-containing protein [Bacteriovoracaceae bacterium]
MSVLYPFISKHNLVVIIMTVSLFAFAGYAQFKNVSISSLLRLLLLIGALFYIRQTFRTFRGLEPGIAFLSLLLGIKVLEMNKKRDFFIFILIVELFLVAQVLSEDSLVIIVYVVVATIFLFYLIFCLNGESKEDFLYDKERLMVTVRIFIHSMPLMLILYFVFPRLNTGYLFPFSINTQSMIGFTGEINPGDIAKVASTDDPVLRLGFKNNSKLQQDEMYLRGSVLAKTNGLSWKKSNIENGHNYNFGNEPLYIYDVLFNELQASQVFALPNTKKIIKKSSGVILKQPTNTWKFVPYNNQKIRYQGVTTKTSPKPLNKNMRAHYLQLPENISVKLKSFAKEMQNKYQTTESLIAAYKIYFLKNEFIYTLSPGTYNKTTGIDDFLFKRRKGFCEHYAAAIGVLLRLNGVPARVVVGFQGGDYNEIGDYFLVKTKDAHAWLEYYNERQGWQRLDPTAWIAPSRIQLGASVFYQLLQIPTAVDRDNFLVNLKNNRLLKFLKSLDMIYYEMNQRFLEFDFEAQKNLFKKLKLNIRRPYQLMIGLTLLLCLLFFIYNYFFIKTELSHSIIDQSYNNFLRKIEKRHIHRELFQGPLALLKTLDPKRDDYHELSSILIKFNQLKYMKYKDKNLITKLIRQVKRL